MMPNPCTPDCPDRRAGTRTTPPCHSDCPRRAAFLAEREQLRAAQDRERLVDRYLGRVITKQRFIKTSAQRRRRERTRR